MSGVQYRLADPTGNITLLVESPVAREQRSAVAAALMRLEPTAEQLGFLTETESGLRLEMAGGEFCGNATMSAAAWLCMQTGRCGPVTLGVSGVAAPVRVEVQPPQDGSYACAVTMPPPDAVAACSLPLGDTMLALPAVSFGGLTHLIAETPLPRADAELLLRQWCTSMCVDALGLMLYDRQRQRLDPLVFVPGAGTCVWEHSCASGTTAVGLYLAQRAGAPVTLTLTEPAGQLTVSASPDGSAVLSGSVRLGESKTADL